MAVYFVLRTLKGSKPAGPTNVTWESTKDEEGKYEGNVLALPPAGRTHPPPTVDRRNQKLQETGTTKRQGIGVWHASTSTHPRFDLATLFRRWANPHQPFSYEWSWEGRTSAKEPVIICTSL